MSDLNVEKIIGELKFKLQSQHKEGPLTEGNVVELASSKVKERIKMILNQGSAQSEKLKYIQSLNLESNESSSQMIHDMINNDLHEANISVDIQTQTKIETSKPKIIRSLVLKIRHILQNEIRSTLNPIVNNQIRYNSHSISALNLIAESVKENSQMLESVNESVVALKVSLNDEVRGLRESLKQTQNTLEEIQLVQQLRITELNIRRIYNHHLEREPTHNEIEYWVSIMKSRQLRDNDITNLIISSDEAKQIRKSYLKTKGIQVEENYMAYKKIGNHVFYFDMNDRVLAETFSKDEIYEKSTTKAIKKLIKSGMNVINIGANIGYYTVLIAQQISPTGKIFTFEPFPSNVRFLQKNVEVNDCKNVEIISKAVSNKTQKANLWLKDSGTQHFVSSRELSDFNKIEIETITIDDFLSEKNIKIDFVLIDAEGSEKYVLEGMEKTLQANPDLEIITEYNPHTLELAGTSGQSFLDFIEKLRFSTYLIDDASQKIKPITKSEIFEQFKYPNVANLYLTKKSKNF